MENEPSIEPTPFTEIRDPQINIQEIIEEIESKIPLPPPSQAEWERITKMQFQPESPQGFRKFDPAGTAFLFEKGISPPKFTNPKVWFIKGPIKFIFTRIIEFYSLVDKKLSENRIKAFFSVLHELIRLTKRIQNIETRLENFYTKFLLHSNQSTDLNQIDFGWSTFQYFETAGQINIWENAIEDLKSNNDLIILFPGWGYLLKELTISNIRFHSFSNIPEEVNFIQSKITSNITKITQTFPLKSYVHGNKDVLICIPLNRFPSFLLEKLFAELSVSILKGQRLYLSIQASDLTNDSPFQDVDVTRIDSIKLATYLKSLGFEEERNLTKHSNFQIFRFTKSS